MNPALRSDGTGHVSRRITLMALPLEHESEPDATVYSSADDNHLHSDSGVESHLCWVANAPAADGPSDSLSVKKSSS
jgi:hypothetical protein